jgi:hypothetical protein
MIPIRKIMALLVLVALSIDAIQAQDYDWQNDEYKLVKLKTNSYEKTVLNSFENDDFGFLQEYDFSSDELRRIGRNADEYFRDITLTRREKRTFNKKSVFERSWRDIDRNFPRRGTDHFVNVYLGLNQILEDGKLPNSDDLYSLHPINSTYLAVNFDNVSRVFKPLYIEWGVGLSYQDFAFDNARVEIIKDKDAGSITFTEVADIKGRKSKLNMGHVNIHFVPTLAFGRYNAFRMGFGVYGGYKIFSSTKRKYDDIEGNKQKVKVNDNWYVNQFKYGFRAQIGWDFFDLFVNYDLTELFEEDKIAPRLTPISFGIIF